MDYETYKAKTTREALRLNKDEKVQHDSVKLHWAEAESKIEIGLWNPRRVEVMWVGDEKYAVAVIHKGIMVQYLLVDGSNDTITYDERAWKQHVNAYDIADSIVARTISYVGYKPRPLVKFEPELLNALDGAELVDGDVEGLRGVVARAKRRFMEGRRG